MNYCLGVYSFDSPFSDSGLYVNLTTLNGVGSDFLNLDSVKSGSKLYLHQKWNQIPKEKHEGESEPTKFAIGIEGGFIGESLFDVVKEHALVIVTKNGKQSFPLPDVSLPEFISNICQAIIDNDGMKSKMQVNGVLKHYHVDYFRTKNYLQRTGRYLGGHRRANSLQVCTNIGTGE